MLTTLRWLPSIVQKSERQAIEHDDGVGVPRRAGSGGAGRRGCPPRLRISRHRLDLVAARRAGRGRASANATPQSRSRAIVVGVVAGVDQLHLAELADRLEQPVAQLARALAHRHQRLVDQARTTAPSASPSTTASAPPSENPSRKIESRRSAVRSSSSSRFQLQSMTASRVWWRSGASRDAAAQQREPVLEAALDLGDRHHPHLGGGELDRERQPVEPVDEASGPRSCVEPYAGPRRRGPLAEQLDGVVEAELRQLVDALGGDAERRPGRGEHPQRGRAGDQHLHQVGDRLDEVLAVVEDQQGRGGADLVDDPADQVGAARPRRASRPATDSRTPSTSPTSTATPSGEVTPASSTKCTTGCSASRPIRWASRVLPSPPGPTIEVTREVRIVSASATTSLVAADQAGRLVEQPLAHRSVARQQLGVQRLQLRARVDAEPVGELARGSCS